MPFITHNERVELAEGKPAETPGQYCYIEYVEMVKMWNKEPRWTTAHNIYASMVTYRNTPELLNKPDRVAAMELAWQVFFQNYVMPYERQKEQENGTI